LGGSLADSAAGIAVDNAGDAFVTGKTVSPNFPTFGPVFQPLYGGGNADAFVSELNPTATALVFSTYLGGSNTDTGNAIALDTSGDTFVAGQTCSLDFPLAAPLQETYGGNCDAFVSKIIPSGGVSVIPAGLIFPNQDLNTTSTAQTVTLSNGANGALSITSIAVTGTNPGDFAETNTCGASVPALGTCTISVTFAPTSVTPPTRTAQVTVTDSGSGSPQVIDLTGTAGTAPLVTLSASSLAFSTQQTVGVASSPLSLIVTNTGTAPLIISSAVASGDFAVQANTCTTPLQVTTPASNCTLTVTFTPPAQGASAGSLILTDNAPNSPQIILLTGAGVTQGGVSTSSDFTIAVSPTALALAAGNTGRVTVTVKSLLGSSAVVALSCSGLPSQATCSASPASVTASGTTPATATLSISTTLRTSVPPGGKLWTPGPGPYHPQAPFWILMVILTGIMASAAINRRRRWAWAALALTALFLMSFAACGGGGNGYTNPTGTPAGTYNITVTGTSGSLTHSATVSLTVQ
jgi:hypothetical protein